MKEASLSSKEVGGTPLSLAPIPRAVILILLPLRQELERVKHRLEVLLSSLFVEHIRAIKEYHKVQVVMLYRHRCKVVLDIVRTSEFRILLIPMHPTNGGLFVRCGLQVGHALELTEGCQVGLVCRRGACYTG